MNKQRRNLIGQIVIKISQTRDELQYILNDEEFAFDNMPENLQNSRRGEESQEAIDYMNNAIESLDEVIEELDLI